MARKCAIAKLALTTRFQAQTPCFQLSGRPLPLATSEVPQPSGKRDFKVNLFAAVGTAVAAVFAYVQAGIAHREAERAQWDSERAQRESKEGRTQAAADRMMKPFTPQTKKAEVVQRGIMKTIEKRILRWDQHATIIAGRFGAGKSVAVEEALRDMQGVFVHKVNGNDWKEELFKRLGLDGPDMLEEVLRRVGDELKRPPILLLDIPRTTKQGMDTVSSFAKLLSSDSSLAHVIVCASSAAMAMAFDAGGEERQDNFWVGDLTEDEAEKLLELHGQEDRMDEFLDACGYKAMDLANTCKRYAKVGEQALKAKKAEMEKNAYDDVEIFLRDCKFQTVEGITPAAANILNALLSQKSAGGPSVGEVAGGSGVLARDVAMWMREKGRHPVIWHTKDREYQFASELHANAATEILKSTSQSTP